MKSRPRGRYKKKKHDLILYLKIALICYLTIFGVGYISSDTSAYLSSQVEFTDTFAADEWEVPVNACGEEYTGGANTDSSIEGTEIGEIANGKNVVDCGELSGPIVESCIDNGENIEGEPQLDATSSEEVSTDCNNNGNESSELVCNGNGDSQLGTTSSEGELDGCNENDDKSTEENGDVVDDEEKPGIDSEDGNIESDKDDENKAETDESNEESDGSKVDEEQKPSDENQVQPDIKDEPVTEPVDTNTPDQDSTTAETLEISVD